MSPPAVSDDRVLAHAALDVCLLETPPAAAWALLAAGIDLLLPRLEAEADARRRELAHEVARVRALLEAAAALRGLEPEALTVADRAALRRVALLLPDRLLPVLYRP